MNPNNRRDKRQPTTHQLKRVKGTPKQQRNNRVKLLGIAITCLFIALCGRMLYIQIVHGADYSVRAMRQQTRDRLASVSRDIQPARGSIMDRHMQPLASSVSVFEIFIDVNLLHRERNLNTTASRESFDDHMEALIYHLGISRWDLDTIFATDSNGNLLRPTYHRIVAREVEASVALHLRTNYRHIHATETSLRWYHDPFFAPQVIGFVRGDAMWGLESFFNEQLIGSAGRTFMVQGEIEEIAVRDGFTLVTTLDSDIQHAAQNLVNQTFLEMDAGFVGVIVMDPNTGEILAMAQAPTFSVTEPFNPDFITDPRLQYNWEFLTYGQRQDEMMRMWRNFHTTRSYEPGSIFKPIVIAAAIEEGVLDPNAMFFCGRGKHVATEWIPCWTHHGSLSLTEVIYRSCNVAMFYIVEMLGRDDFYRYRRYFGFGERTGIDLPGEFDVSHPSVMYPLSRLGPVERATSSMGQGFNATSIQSITAYAALINGGNMLQPFLVSQVVDNFGNVVYETQPHIVRRVISQETSDFVRRQMQYTVSADGGTARSSRIPGHTIGGKTGTGEQGRADDIVSLTYVAFTPVENPEFLVLMVVDRICTHSYGGAGNELGPRVRRLFEEVISLRGLPPSDIGDDITPWQPTHAGGLMPDYSGQRLITAVQDLSNRSSGGFQVIGQGAVVSHTIPAPGVAMPQNSTVFFYMEAGTRIEGQMAIVPNIVGLTVEQAELVLREAGLPTVLRETSTPAPTMTQGTPRTSNRLTAEEREQANNGVQGGAATPLQYVVTVQYPSPGTEVERGTMVMIRAR